MPGGKGAKTRPCSAHVRCSVWLLTVGVARPCLVFNCLCSTVNQQKCFLFEYCLPSDALVSTSFLFLLVRHFLLVAMHLLLIVSSFFGSCVPECLHLTLPLTLQLVLSLCFSTAAQCNAWICQGSKIEWCARLWATDGNGCVSMEVQLESKQCSNSVAERNNLSRLL